ncbi:hypothetical protein TIFTF001_052817 [Ficus carica]|uniref:Secreted protein n=1 Tax=Ficus carica TaxID=3494 RepID=A0AA87ZD40_FICCA|nr:hypothetical protein TIFTF001_045561 [Ficus carica]GMN22491.1 hypothetical protein TIFTF001_040269 [Ficus carica]GMN27683.1 hypothetical protein TIFTF001_041065 [Ficus carica]GMN27746.1 hypothetical protein TIFTF001_041072 [Ficus carica]GMN27777.1 hypothetical protein TIFTF001_041076 [Ficus carica]
MTSQMTSVIIMIVTLLALHPWQAKACTHKHQGRPNKGATHGQVLLTWQAQALPKLSHDRPFEEATPLGVALMSQHPKFTSLASLASQGLHTHHARAGLHKGWTHQHCSLDEQAL